ncbi:MAG: ABC-2 family transporter protein [Myxococcota bacterium]
MTGARYFILVGQMVRTSAVLAMRYRMQFLVELVMSVFWVIWTVAPLSFAFQHRENIGGWRMPEALLVMGFFIILKAVLEGTINPNLLSVVEHIRKGTLDFVLIKPVDSQFLVSASRLEPVKIVDVAGGLAVLGWALHELRLVPGPTEVFSAAGMMFASVLILYAVWLLAICTAFWFVRIDNLAHLFASILDAGRWPLTVFRGWLRFVLTFVVPVGLMTSFPAMALRGTLETSAAFTALGVAVGFVVVSRVMWKTAVRHYRSASS